ncbi:MAG: putative metalloprotease CJM1_0395 family protein [Desulfocapsaceae bacterium]|nr:putative metalloprotease CJM1_0395 family protein [Desulfocapsaceae bacterium]
MDILQTNTSGFDVQIPPSAYSSRNNQPASFTSQDGGNGNLQSATDSSTQQPDTVSLSNQGKELSAGVNPDQNQKTLGSTPAHPPATGTESLDAHDQEVIQQLRNRDAHVRAHEAAHMAVAGQYAAGPASFTYETGPDGVKYAIGGEVPIDTSAERTPEATIRKMEVVQRTALAPADPSSADRQIAAEASAKQLQAEQELQAEQQEKTKPQASSSPRTTSGSSPGQASQAYQAVASLA